MGHLINPISLRLKRYGIWQVSWNAFLKRDYTYFFFASNLLNSILLSFSNLFCLRKKVFFFEIKYILNETKLILFLVLKLYAQDILNLLIQN